MPRHATGLNAASPPASRAGGERNLNQWFDRILNEFY
jgi:hypothetical protein